MKHCDPHGAAHIGPLMGYCDHQIHKIMDRALRALDISPMQSRVLGYLCCAQSEVNQRQLEQFLMVKPSTVNGIVIRLEEKGLITRTVSEADGRCRILRPTPAGQEAHRTVREVMEQVDQRVEGCFSAEELAVLRRLLQTLAEDLSQEKEDTAL